MQRFAIALLAAAATICGHVAHAELSDWLSFGQLYPPAQVLQTLRAEPTTTAVDYPNAFFIVRNFHLNRAAHATDLKQALELLAARASRTTLLMQLSFIQREATLETFRQLARTTSERILNTSLAGRTKLTDEQQSALVVVPEFLTGLDSDHTYLRLIERQLARLTDTQAAALYRAFTRILTTRAPVERSMSALIAEVKPTAPRLADWLRTRQLPATAKEMAEARNNGPCANATQAL